MVRRRLLLGLTLVSLLVVAPAPAHAGLLPPLDLGLLDPLLGSNSGSGSSGSGSSGSGSSGSGSSGSGSSGSDSSGSGSGSSGSGSSGSNSGPGSGLLAPVLAPLAPATGAVGETVGAVTETVGTVTTITPTASEQEDPKPATTGEPGTAPETGESVGVVPDGGPVTVTLPGAGGTVTIHEGVVVPVGSVVDATATAVRLVSVRDAHGRMQTGVFSGGRFEIRQAVGGVTELVLRGGDFGRCARQRDASGDARRRATAGLVARRLRPTARAAGSPVVRRLWGKDRSGRFRTRGRHAAATVRGTRWLTEDRCHGTRVAVEEGSVSVWPTAGGRSRLVRAGDSLLTPAR